MHRITGSALLALSVVAPGAAVAFDPPPPALDRFATIEVRKAFSDAARDRRLWDVATLDGEAYLRERGVEVPADLSVTFLNVERGGDLVRFSGHRFEPRLDFYCPPERMWWQECARIMRVCDTEQVAVRRGDDIVIVEIETNCYFVCEQSIWEERFTPTIRPPFPPLP
jgi:hypothetical protein